MRRARNRPLRAGTLAHVALELSRDDAVHLADQARAEFAEFGLAGARVDRIAANSASNKAQIYHYFGSKDQLFDAVWESIVKQVVERRRSTPQTSRTTPPSSPTATPTTPTSHASSPGSASNAEPTHPTPSPVRSTQSKVDAIAD